MLQKVAKDRLDKVLSIIEISDFRFANKEIAESLGVGKSTVSDYLSGTKPMSKPFFELFMKKYSNLTISNADTETKKPSSEIGKAEDSVMKETMRNLSESNINLAIAFVKQASAHEKEADARLIHATAHEKDADARIIQASANRVLVEVNRDTLSKIPNLNLGDTNYQVSSDSAVRVIDAMAKTLVRDGKYSTVQEATDYLDTLLNGDSAAAALKHNPKKMDKQNIQHKQT